ncbi:prepilin peptidase [Candidatus Peribacteria bacterium]|nr:MAG: prepilin peptidase [Candidatus Peribacteria bacterium]
MSAIFLDPIVAIPLLAILGLVFGSFGNVLMDRVTSEKSMGGRSHCMSCHRILTPWELVPVISFCALRGKCYQCKAQIPWEYTLIELLGGALFVVAGMLTSYALLPALFLALALWSMLLIGIVDARTQLIPDLLTAVLGLSALLYHVFLGDVVWTGALLAFAFFGLQWALSRGHWVGSGDILLGIALGLLLGPWQYVVVMLMGAYIVGALLVSVLLGLGSISRTQHIAFGPFLVVGTVISLLFGEVILRVVWPM